MAVLTVVRSGNWDDTNPATTPWTALTGSGVGGTPGAGDTVTHAIAATVTVPVGSVCVVGTAPQDITTAVYTTSNNAAKLIVYGELQLRGNMAMGGGGAGNQHLRVDSTTGGVGKLKVMSSLNLVNSRYVLNIGTSGASNPTRLFVEGVLGARASIVSDSPGVSMWNITGNVSLYSRYADFHDMTTALSGVDISGMQTVLACPTTAGNTVMDTDRVVFWRCGQITMGSPTTLCTSSIKRTVFKNSACSRYNLRYTASVNNTITLERVTLDGPMQSDSSALRWSHLFMETGVDGSGQTFGGSTMTGQYAVTVSEINQGAHESTVSGAVKDHVRWFDGRRCRIIGVDTVNDILTLDRAHPYGTAGTQTTQLWNYPDTLPAGMSQNLVNYYVRSEASNQISLYDTSAHAIAGGATGRLNITGSTPGGAISRGNPHWSNGQYQQRHIFLFTGHNQDGDTNNGMALSGLCLMEDNLLIPNVNGWSPGVLISPTTGNIETYRVNRNTAVCDSAGLIHIGEQPAVTGVTGMWEQVQANLAFTPTAGVTVQQAIYTVEPTGVPEKLNAAGALGNWIDGGSSFTTVGSVYELVDTQTAPGFTSASPPDLPNTPANFIAKGRTIDHWAAWFGARVGASGDGITTPGTQATPENAFLLCKQMYDGTFSEALAEDGIRLMCEYLRRGYIPTNPVGRAASVGGKTAGMLSAWAPAVSAPTANATQGGFTTNCPDGVSAWVITTSAVSPDEDRIRAGKDHTGASVSAGFSGTVSVTSAGVKTFSYAPTLLPATDYYLHLVHTADDVANGVPGQDAYLRTSEPVTSAAFQASGSATSNNAALSLLGVG